MEKIQLVGLSMLGITACAVAATLSPKQYLKQNADNILREITLTESDLSTVSLVEYYNHSNYDNSFRISLANNHYIDGLVLYHDGSSAQEVGSNLAGPYKMDLRTAYSGNYRFNFNILLSVKNASYVYYKINWTINKTCSNINHFGIKRLSNDNEYGADPINYDIYKYEKTKTYNELVTNSDTGTDCIYHGGYRETVLTFGGESGVWEKENSALTSSLTGLYLAGTLPYGYNLSFNIAEIKIRFSC